jgi:hypothetical protein
MLYGTQNFIKPFTIEQVKEQFYKDMPKSYVLATALDKDGNVILARAMTKDHYDHIMTKCAGRPNRGRYLFYL